MRSLYWWEGRIEESSECVMIAKSVESHQDGIIAKVKELHGYRVPCIVFWPLIGGNPDFLDWIAKETGAMPRLFIALDFPETVKDGLSEVCGNLPGADWVYSDQFHLTLRFLGEQDQETFYRIREALHGLQARSFPIFP